MPEDFEAETPDLQEEGTPEAVEAAPETPPETETKPRTIPFERFQEVYDDLKSTRQGYQQMQMQVMQMQQQLMAASKPQAPAPKIDPDVAELIDPILRQRLEPYEQRIREMQQREATMWANQESQAAWDYVKSAVTDLDELAPDIQSYLATLPQARVNKITADPDLVIQTAEYVRAMKQMGKSVGTQVAKQDLKQRTKSDAGTASPASFNSKIDWTAMSDEEFAAHEAKLEAARRRAR